MSIRRLTGATALLVMAYAVGGCASKPNNGSSNSGGGGGGGGGGGDQDAMILANLPVNSPIPFWPKDPSGLKKGWWVETHATASGHDVIMKYAVVDDAGDVLKVEASAPMAPYIEALVVRRADGTVTEAKGGKPGGTLYPMKINPAPTATAGDVTPTDETITVQAGKFNCKKVVAPSGAISWTGADGDATLVPVKTDDGKGKQKELVTLTVEDWSCGGLKAKAKHCVYSDKSEFWWIADPIPFVGIGPTAVKMILPTVTMAVDGQGMDATAQLKWQ